MECSSPQTTEEMALDTRLHRTVDSNSNTTNKQTLQADTTNSSMEGGLCL